MKKQSRANGVEAAVGSLRKRLTAWRRSQGSGRGRIPEALWKEATEAARTFGVAKVSRVLALDYYSLKRRTNGEEKPHQQQAPSFMELVTASPRSGIVIERESRKGGKFRLELLSENWQEVAALSERLWRSSR